MREFAVFLAVLNGRAYQTRFKSEQSIRAALGMLVYFTYFGPYNTHKYNTQMDDHQMGIVRRHHIDSGDGGERLDNEGTM